MESGPEWDHLEEWLRGQVQGLIQHVLEEEVTEFLGRAKSARRSSDDSDAVYRNGYAPSRSLTLSSGTIRVRRPRVGDTEESATADGRRLLPPFLKRSKQLSELIPELYLHGLSEGDFDLALRGLLGDEAPLSASTVSRLKERWSAELSEWSARRLDELEVVYVWVDGVYVKAGFERDKAAVLVVNAALSDGSKVVLSAEHGNRETPTAPGHDRVIYPGLSEHEWEQERRANGIPLHNEVIEWFSDICAELQLPALRTA